MLVCPLCRLTLGENETTCPRDGREGAEASAVDVPASIRERFKIVEPYGRGDSGDLFLVDDKKSSRRGVLKIVRLPEQTTPAEKARLKRELVKQATLSHGVLTVPLATGEADGHPWVFRDWHEGVSLAVRLARGGALAVPEALTIAAQAASALDELHRAGLLHRDLKPGHIIVEPQPSGLPRVHVIDAGLPARLETGAVFDVMGTAAYLSPEQAKGKLVSFRSDLYALGCVLFEMLSGAPPFEGDVEALLAAHAKESAPTLKVEMPGAVATLLSRLLSKEPRERPFSAQQVRRALEPFLPEDASSSREATQAFDQGADSKRRVPSPKTSGTLPPPSKGKTSVPPPPPSAATKPKGASVPPPPRKPGARPVKQTSKTLMGMPLSAASGAAATPAATPNSTEELSAVDLEQAEEILKAPKVNSAALGGALGGLDAAVSATPKGASVPSPPKSQPPASESEAPPWDAKEIHPTEPPVAASAPDASAPPGAEASAPPDGDSDEDDDDLDYDDLAETVMFDREGEEEGALPPVAGSTPPPGNPDPYATPAPEPVAAAAEVAPAKKSKPWGLIVLGLLAGGCLLFTGIAGGVGYWFYGQAEDAVADLDRELQNPNFGNGQPGFPGVNPPPNPQPFNPTPPPTPTPPPVLVQPTPPPTPVVEEPVVEEPVVEEPVVEEPVREEPVRTEPARTEPRTERPATERPRPSEGGGNRQARFEAARQRALAAYRAGRFPQAAQAYEEATQINSRHAGSFAGLGACRMRMGQHSRAVRAYQRAIQLSPRHAGFYAALGSAYHASGDRNRARQAYQRALALDPNNAGARQGLSRL